MKRPNLRLCGTVWSRLKTLLIGIFRYLHHSKISKLLIGTVFLNFRAFFLPLPQVPIKGGGAPILKPPLPIRGAPLPLIASQTIGIAILASMLPIPLLTCFCVIRNNMSEPF